LAIYSQLLSGVLSGVLCLTLLLRSLENFHFLKKQILPSSICSNWFKKNTTGLSVRVKNPVLFNKQLQCSFSQHMSNTSSRAKSSASVLQSMENKKRGTFAGSQLYCHICSDCCPGQKPEGQI